MSLLWILWNWKLVLPLLLIGLVAFVIFTPVALAWVKRHRIGLLIAAGLFASHGAVAGATKTYFTDAAERARLVEENRQARITIKVIQGDQIEAERLRAQLRAKEVLIEDLRNELTDPDRIVFDEPDADRLRRIWD
jgi:hypothetical protein